MKQSMKQTIYDIDALLNRLLYNHPMTDTTLNMHKNAVHCLKKVKDGIEQWGSLYPNDLAFLTKIRGFLSFMLTEYAWSEDMTNTLTNAVSGLDTGIAELSEKTN